MKIIFSLIFGMFFMYIGRAQEHKHKVYYEETDTGEFTFFAENDEYYPISIKLNFLLKNMQLNDIGYKIYTIAGKAKQELTTLKVISRTRPYQFSYTYIYNMGDDSLEDYDKDYVYHLPYQKGLIFRLIQGYNGSFSHKNENSLDFSMPVGTEITAIREGIVVKVEDSNNKNCASIECAEYNNFVTIYHSDGTFADYLHIKQGGALVKEGDRVVKGQVVALSGNTGFSSTPHLHLEVFKQRLNAKETLPTKFLLRNGNIDFLEENRYY